MQRAQARYRMRRAQTTHNPSFRNTAAMSKQTIIMPGSVPAKAEGRAADVQIKDTTSADFVKDVIEASRSCPVLVDFWAPWCGPCKQLTPVLEKLVHAARGKIALVKLDIEAYPEIAQQLGIQSIPTIFAFKNGRGVDAIAGLQPENRLKAFIERLAGPIGPSAEETLLEEAQEARLAKNFAGASQLYTQVLADNPEQSVALAGLVYCYLGLGDIERARGFAGSLPEHVHKGPEVAGALAALRAAEKAGSVSTSLEELHRQVEAQPDNLALRFDLAICAGASGKAEEAAEELLTIIGSDQNWQDGKAKKQLLEFFSSWGEKSPATINGRRRLSALLFS